MTDTTRIAIALACAVVAEPALFWWLMRRALKRRETQFEDECGECTVERTYERGLSDGAEIARAMSVQNAIESGRQEGLQTARERHIAECVECNARRRAVRESSRNVRV